MYQAVSSRRHNSIPSINNLSCKGLAGTPFAEKHKPHLSVAGLASMAAVAGHTLVTETLQFIGSSLMRMQDDKIKRLNTLGCYSSLLSPKIRVGRSFLISSVLTET